MTTQPASEEFGQADTVAGEGRSTPESTSPPKILYLGGTGRTGTTMLDRLLGQLPGWFSAGEVAYIWECGLVRDGICSCREPVATCPVWSAALAAASPDGPVDAARMVQLRRRFWSAHLPRMVLPGASRRGLDRLEELPQVIERLYRGVATATGARVIIDSSKEPHYSYILRERTDLDVYFLHLVRDPRAVGFSWRKKRPESGFPGDELMEQRGSAKAALYYDVSNAAAEALWRSRPDRYRFLRYEDFLSAPERTIASIAQFIGEDVDPTSILENREFTPIPSHMAWGNPNRFNTDRIHLKTDEDWRRELGRRPRAELMALTAPLATRYGYPWRSTADPHATPRSSALRRSSLLGGPAVEADTAV